MAKTFSLIRTKRRSIALIVQRDGTLVVRAPLRASLHKIEELVSLKADWIRQKQALARRLPAPAPHRFLPGETFWYLGKIYPLQINIDFTTHLPWRAVPGQVCGENSFVLNQGALPKAKEHFTAWYKAQARRVIEERVQWFAARYGLHQKTGKRVRITSARTRWGSCSASGALSFTWRLVMAPPAAIDYVVAHELAHLLVRNHSPAFWRKLGELLPDYRTPQQWLKQNGHLLTLD